MLKTLLKDVVKVDPESDEAKRITTKVGRPAGKFDVFQDVSLQCDIIYMPKDQGYKYLLTCIELKSKTADVEPLKTKNAEELHKAFVKIWNRNIINPNIQQLYTDKGKEFENKLIQDFFKSHGIMIKYSLTNRHSQQGMIERFNYVIKKVLWSKMSIEEEKNQKTNTEWVKYIRNFIIKYNQSNSKMTKEKPISHWFGDPVIKKNERILPENTEVHRMLDYPIDYTGKRLYGNRPRAGEFKYEKRKRKIERICIYPNQPVKYMLSGLNNVSYQRNQLILA